jgi:PAB1-binding protein PBP1
LGVKKRSYIDQLNEHSEECSQEVDRLEKTLNKFQKHNIHIIGLEKRGESNEDYSLIDRDLFYKIHTKLGKYNAQIFILWIED